jgi:hypothetical protein
MKRIASQAYLFPLIVLDMCFLMEPKINYYLGFWLIPDSDFGSLFLVRFIATIAIIAYSIILIALLARRSKYILNASLLSTLLIVLLASLGEPDPNNAIIYGLKDRLMRDLQVNGLNQFARDVDGLPYPNGTSGDKVFMHEDMKLVEMRLHPKYGFLADKYAPSSVEEIDGVVNVWWGRRQWGFSVKIPWSTNGPLSFRNGDIIILPVSENVLFRYANE